jgi:hypothetical protein
MNSQELSSEQKWHSELEKNNWRNWPSETKEIIEILSEMEEINTKILVRIKDIRRRLNKNNVKNLLWWEAWIDYDTLPWHIIIRDWEGWWYILKDKNEWISKKNPLWDYTFEEAQKLVPEWYHIPSSEEWKWLYELGMKLRLWKKDYWSAFMNKLNLINSEAFWSSSLNNKTSDYWLSINKYSATIPSQLYWIFSNSFSNSLF